MPRRSPLHYERTITTLGVAILLALGLSGCLGSTQGTVSVYLRSNGNEEFTEVEITIGRVSILSAGAGIGDGPGSDVERGAEEGEQQEPTPKLITESSNDVDLLQYQQPESRAHLGDARIGQGTYALVILRIDGDLSGTLRDDGSQVTIQARSSEFREAVNFEVEAGETTRIILEVDLEEGIVQNDQGEYRFSPRIADAQVQQRATGGEEDTRDRGV